jgi:methionine aminotransferase
LKILPDSKLPNIGTNIFTKMSSLATSCKAINLSQGYPDFGVDEKLIKLVKKYLDLGFDQYAPMQGVLKLREAVSEKYYNLYGRYYHENDEITITAGATQAIFTALTAFINQGDEVLIFSPTYDCYEPAIQLNGGKPVFIELDSPNFKIDWQKVENKISNKTRMIIVNSPQNPLGTILTNHDFLTLEEISEKYDLLVLSDEVYEHLVYDGKKHFSVGQYPNLFKRSIASFSFGKTFHVTGWKLGYVLAPNNLMTEIRKVHQFNVFSCNHPFQLAIAEYLENNETYLKLNEFYQRKRDLFLDIISASRFTANPCNGTYFQLLNYSKISNLPDVEMAENLTTKNGVASIPISVFSAKKNDEKNLRFCFAKTDETLKKAGEILIKI